MLPAFDAPNLTFARSVRPPHRSSTPRRSASVEPKARDFLIRLLETPSPSGYERPVQELVRDYLAGIADTVTTDSHGNVIGGRNTGGPVRLLFTARGSLETPASSGWRASSSNTICLATVDSSKVAVGMLRLAGTTEWAGEDATGVPSVGSLAKNAVFPGVSVVGRVLPASPCAVLAGPNHGAHRMPAWMPRANVARRSAARSTSSSDTVSTAECM